MRVWCAGRRRRTLACTRTYARTHIRELIFLFSANFAHIIHNVLPRKVFGVCKLCCKLCAMHTNCITLQRICITRKRVNYIILDLVVTKVCLKMKRSIKGVFGWSQKRLKSCGYLGR